MKTMWFSLQNHVAYAWGKERERKRGEKRKELEKGERVHERVWEREREGGKMWIWLVFDIRFNLNIFFSNASAEFTLHQGLMFKDHKMRKAIKLLQEQTCTCWKKCAHLYLPIFISKGLQHIIQNLVKPDHY